MRVSSLRLVVLAAIIGSGSRPCLAQDDPCVASSLALSTRALGPSTVGPHTTAIYAIDATDPRPSICEPRTLLFGSRLPLPVGFELFAAPNMLRSAPGATVTTTASVTATYEAQPGDYRIPLRVLGWGTPEPVVELPLRLEAAPPCSVDPLRELFIRGASVVDDPIRTSFEGDQASSGAWTFGRLLTRAAPAPSKAPRLVREFLENWLREQRINSFSAPARPAMDRLVLAPWPKRADGQLDLRRAPFRLLAIVARLDLADATEGHAGELRFVFGLIGPGGHPSQFTLILEYRVPARSDDAVLAWARRFHELGTLPFPSEKYNAALQTLTDAITAPGASPGRVNGSALSTVRTNENVLGTSWELRQFQLSRATGMLVQTTIDRTPDISFLNDELVAEFINRNEGAILKGDYSVPAKFLGRPFLAAASVNMFPSWAAPGVATSEARREFALNTCDGCHGSAVTGTDFTHLHPREAGDDSRLSGFLLGIALRDSVTGTLHTYNELGRRKLYVEQLVCAPPGADRGQQTQPLRRRDH